MSTSVSSQSKTKRFRPPLKSSTNSPLTTVDNLSSQNSLDSLPATQTHTVLSYCEDYHSESSTHNDSSEEHCDQEQPSRFRAHRPEALSGIVYDYTGHNNRKRTVADVEKTKPKRVRITSPERQGHLSVYDYQPTPQETTEVVSNERGNKGRQHRVDVSGYCSSREEQLAIDEEVIELIRRTRLEIKAIKQKYASRSRSNYVASSRLARHRGVTLPLKFNSIGADIGNSFTLSEIEE